MLLACWSRELAALEGTYPDGLEKLLEEGLVQQTGECFMLTSRGADRREEVARECYVPAVPGTIFY